jgi:chemotaxis signal transduction protein
MSARLLIARIGAERIALAVESVREVIDAPLVTPLPLAPAGLAGQFALRGVQIPMLDPGELLGIVRSGESAGAALVLADRDAALWVDDAEDVWESASADERPIPSGSDRRGVLRALLQRGAMVVAAVDAGALSAAASATLRQGR